MPARRNDETTRPAVSNPILRRETINEQIQLPELFQADELLSCIQFVGKMMSL